MTVLESSSVDERGLAKTIMEKYCPSEQQKGIPVATNMHTHTIHVEIVCSC